MKKLSLILLPALIGGIVLFLIDYFAFSEINWERNLTVILVMSVMNAVFANRARKTQS